MTALTRNNYMGVAVQLAKIEFPSERITALHQYVSQLAKKGKWSSFTVNALAKYANEFLAQQPKSSIPLVDKELDDLFAQHFSNRSANDA